MATTPPITAFVLAVLGVCVAWEMAVAVSCRVEVATRDRKVSFQMAVDGREAGEWRFRGSAGPRSRHMAAWMPGSENGPATLGMGAAMLLFLGVMVRRRMARGAGRRGSDARRLGSATVVETYGG